MKVLLGIGASDTSFEALDRTVERAREAGDDLTVALLVGAESVDDPDELTARVRDRLSEAGVDAEIRRVTGNPGSRLVELADGEEFDQLVIPGGERSAMGKISLGPITEFVVLNAETTVTLVR